MSEFRNVTLRERIYDEVVRMIISGELPHGALIDERAMAERLSVSRTPFREALGTLIKDGLVESRPYRGTFVRSFTPAEVNDIFEVRKALERLAITLAVRRMVAADVARITQILDAAVQALYEGDLAAYAAHDRTFHETIAQLSGNGALMQALARLSVQVQACRIMANQHPGVAERTAQERTEILHALEHRDADQAAALMEQHIAGVQKSVMAQLAPGPDGGVRRVP